MKKYLMIFLPLLIAFLLFSSCSEQNLKESYTDIIAAFSECSGQAIQTNIKIICKPKEESLFNTIKTADNILNNYSYENKSIDINNNDNIFLYTISAKLKGDGIIHINAHSKNTADTYIEAKINVNNINEETIFKTINLTKEIKNTCKSIETKVQITSIFEGRVTKENAKEDLLSSISNKRLLKAISKQVYLESRYSDYDNKTYVTYTLDIF